MYADMDTMHIAMEFSIDLHYWALNGSHMAVR